MSEISSLSFEQSETRSDGVVVSPSKSKVFQKRFRNLREVNRKSPIDRTRFLLFRFFSCFGDTSHTWSVSKTGYHMSVNQSTSPKLIGERNAPNIFHIEALEDRQNVFYDRIEAGKVLAGLLKKYWSALASTEEVSETAHPVSIYGIPAGGIPVAATIASELSLTLHAAVISKILLPWNTEVGCGAVSFRGTVKWNEQFLHSIGLSKTQLRKQLDEAMSKVQRRTEALGGMPLLPNEDCTVLLVDDGLASGLTMTLAVEEFRKLGAKTIIVVVPTGLHEVVLKMAKIADFVFCANIRRETSFAVAAAYEHWYDEKEDEMVDLMKSLKSSI